MKIPKIKLVVTDIDGVWTDSKIHYTSNDIKIRSFTTYDGMGVESLRLKNIHVIIISGEICDSITSRAKKVNIDEVYLGIKDKFPFLVDLCKKKNINLSNVAYIGDDINDLDCLRSVGFSACPPNTPVLRYFEPDLITEKKGGDGSFREFAEKILQLSPSPSRLINIGEKEVGDNKPTFIIAEIGINHNGSLELAKELISAAAESGADAVKFQKRTPKLCVPIEEQNKNRDTPWGRMTYLEYKNKIEFWQEEYQEIADACDKHRIMWSASCWDIPSVNFIANFYPKFLKVPSSGLTDSILLEAMRDTNIPLIISTGMSSWEEIIKAVSIAGESILLAHSTSIYPCPNSLINLKMIKNLKVRYPHVPIGYSGHETSIYPTVASVAYGANFVERHFTLDNAMYGTDQAASLNPQSFKEMVKGIREVEIAKGNGEKFILEEELPYRLKLKTNSQSVYE